MTFDGVVKNPIRNLAGSHIELPFYEFVTFYKSIDWCKIEFNGVHSKTDTMRVFMENGTKGELVYTVQESDLADRVALGSEDQFPRVFATSRMFALMELTAARVMKPLLQSGELSVGVGVDLKHFAPTPVAEEVRVVATYLGLEKKLHSFDIQVFDRAGKVGIARHTRAIVETSRILDGALARMAEVD